MGKYYEKGTQQVMINTNSSKKYASINNQLNEFRLSFLLIHYTILGHGTKSVSSCEELKLDSIKILRPIKLHLMLHIEEKFQSMWLGQLLKLHQITKRNHTCSD